MHVSNSMSGKKNGDPLMARQMKLKEFCNRELLLWHLGGKWLGKWDKIKPYANNIMESH